MPGQTVAALIARGWTRDDGAAEVVGDCTHPYGCPRAGRWTHPNVQGAYCAQHAYGAFL
jgi:hypothetical protein